MAPWVIGHEISHLFDDQGRLYDGDGLLRDWWTRDAQQFEAVASRQGQADELVMSRCGQARQRQQ